MTMGLEGQIGQRYCMGHTQRPIPISVAKRNVQL